MKSWRIFNFSAFLNIFLILVWEREGSGSGLLRPNNFGFGRIRIRNIGKLYIRMDICIMFNLHNMLYLAIDFSKSNLRLTFKFLTAVSTNFTSLHIDNSKANLKLLNGSKKRWLFYSLLLTHLWLTTTHPPAAIRNAYFL